MDIQHVSNPDGKIQPRSFWCVTGRALKAGTDKPVGIALTFDNKDLAIRCFKAWNLTAAIKSVKIKKTECDWEDFTPSSKADLDLWEKIQNNE